MNIHLQNYYSSFSKLGMSLSEIDDEINYLIMFHYFYVSPRCCIAAKQVNLQDAFVHIQDPAFVHENTDSFYIHFMSGHATDIFDVPHDFKPEKVCWIRDRESNRLRVYDYKQAYRLLKKFSL